MNDKRIQISPLARANLRGLMKEPVQISPLARAYLSAVRSGQVSEDSPEHQLADAATYILRYGVRGCTADVLRVVAALCEACAELKDENGKDHLPRRSGHDLSR